MKDELTTEDLEDHAFYESGLSADGCLENLDDYAIKAIKKYGEILLEKQKEDFVKGFKGCCYCCEPVGIANVELEKENEKLRDCLMEIYKDDGQAIISKIEKVLNISHDPMWQKPLSTSNTILNTDCAVNKALKNLNKTLDSCIGYLKPKETNKKSFWKRFKELCENSNTN